MTLEDQVLKYLDGELSPQQLEQWCVRTRAFETLFGEEGYTKLLTLGAAEQEEAIWTKLRALLGERFPAEALAERAVRICEGLLDGTVDIVGGVRRMWILRQGDVETWARIDRSLGSVPAPEQYGLWEPTALAEKLERLEAQREHVMTAARLFTARRPQRR
jgi:hypothetical protein